MITLSHLIAAANTAPPDHYLRLYFGDVPVGLIHRQAPKTLEKYGFYLVSHALGVQWRDASANCARNSEHLAQITANMRADGYVTGWRDELFALSPSYYHAPQALIERAAMPIFGGCGYGVHINGLVRRKNGLAMWLGQRAPNKPTEPNKWDQIAAGGLPYGISAFNNMQKECREEANIPESLSQTAQSVGMVSYCWQQNNGIRADVLFLYDLFLPADFEPQNTDGEVAHFICVPLEEIPEMLREGDVKTNSALVMLDCCIRHGIITPQMPEYETLCHGLQMRNHWLSRLKNK